MLTQNLCVHTPPTLCLLRCTPTPILLLHINNYHSPFTQHQYIRICLTQTLVKQRFVVLVNLCFLLLLQLLLLIKLPLLLLKCHLMSPDPQPQTSQITAIQMLFMVLLPVAIYRSIHPQAIMLPGTPTSCKQTMVKFHHQA